MGILKKGSYKETPISNLTFSNINFTKEDNTETLKFDKEEYLTLVDEAKRKGYEEGLERGYQDGYNEGFVKFEEEKEILYNSLDSDKESLREFLQIESLNYINNYQAEIKNLILNSINKVFFNALKDEFVLETYLDNLVAYLNKSFEEYSLIANAKTLFKVEDIMDKNKSTVKIDNSLSDYDVIVVANNEYKEYFLEEEFNKIKELFA